MSNTFSYSDPILGLSHIGTKYAFSHMMLDLTATNIMTSAFLFLHLICQCLYEVGKHNKIQLLDIFCEATDPTLSSLDPSNHKLERSFNGQNLAEGRLDFKGGLIGQLIHTVRYVLCRIHLVFFLTIQLCS